jgi:hypothetical protein
VWSRYQANNCLLSPIHYDAGAQSIRSTDWNDAANRVIEEYGPPPFENPVGCNSHGASLMNFGHTDEARWLTFHQIGNDRRDHYSYAQLTDEFYTNPPVPALNGEPQYEGMVTLTSPNNKTWTFRDVRLEAAPSEGNARAIRSTAYGSVLSGGLAGHIYGAGGWDGGIWRADVEDASPVCIWDAMEWPAAGQMQFVSDFLLSEGKRYRDLQPVPWLLTPSRAGFVAGYEGWSFCAATAERDLVMIYQEQDTPTVTLSGMPPGADYEARWYDPRTGKWLEPQAVAADGDGKITLPAKPDTLDWALKLKGL